MDAVKKPKHDSEDAVIRKAKRKLFLGCVLGVLGFAVLLAGAILDVQTTRGIVLLLAAFLACDIIAIVLLINARPGLAISDINKIDRKYDQCELTELHGMKRYEVEQILRSHKFQYDDNGYYWRKKFAIWKDHIWYYVKIEDSSDWEKTIRREWEHFNKLDHDGKNVCLILMLYTSEMTDKEAGYLRNAGKCKIADDMVLDVYSLKTMVVVGVEQTTHIGRYLDIGRGHSLYLYTYGCKLLEKLFGKRSAEAGSLDR